MNDDDYQKMRDFFVDLIKMYETASALAEEVNLGEINQTVLLDILDCISAALANSLNIGWNAEDQAVVDDAIQPPHLEAWVELRRNLQ